MSSMIGEKLRVSLFGESHGAAVGVVLDGLPAGEPVDIELVQAFLHRRAPGNAPYATARREADAPEILSGLLNGKTCGTPLCAVIRNEDAQSEAYPLRDLPRPGHADYTAWLKFGEARDARGGGHASGRLSAPLCFAGAVCLQLLARRGVHIGAHILSVGEAADEAFCPVAISPEALAQIAKNPFPVLSQAAGEAMQALILQAKAEGDSLGGVVECAAVGLPAGIGEPMFGGVENRLSAALFGIPAVKGVEFGAGFRAARMAGSENNDAFYVENGAVKTRTNHCGGILGGVTTGMPVLLRAAFKPTPSIAVEQDTVDLSRMENAKLRIRGRHDPCILPRAVPCVEAAVAVTLLDMLLSAER